MTAIVAISESGRVWMGADSVGVNVDSLSTTVRTDEKVFFNGPFVIAFTGSYRMGALLRYYLKVPEQPAEVSDEVFMNVVFIESIRKCFKDGGYAVNQSGREVGGKFFVGYKGRIYVIDSDYQVGMSSVNYAAAGCGADLCLGSLHTTSYMKEFPPEERIKLSLLAAETFNGGVKGPFIVKVIGDEVKAGNEPKNKKRNTKPKVSKKAAKR